MGGPVIDRPFLEPTPGPEAGNPLAEQAPSRGLITRAA
jgi:hypothetical protein